MILQEGVVSKSCLLHPKGNALKTATSDVLHNAKLQNTMWSCLLFPVTSVEFSFASLGNCVEHFYF